MLVVGVLNVTDNNTASDDQNVFFQTGVDLHTADDWTGVADGVVKLDLVACSYFSLSNVAIRYIWLRWSCNLLLI